MSDAIARAAQARQTLELAGEHLDRIRQESLEAMMRADRDQRDELLSLALACDALKKRLNDDVAGGLIAQRRAELDEQAG